MSQLANIQITMAPSTTKFIWASTLALTAFVGGFMAGHNMPPVRFTRTRTREPREPVTVVKLRDLEALKKMAKEGEELKKAQGAQQGEVDDDEEEDGDEAALDVDIAAIQAGAMEPCKMVLIVRTDVAMSPGKVAAQCSHATLACYKALAKKNPKLVKHWERTGQAKIALKAKSEDELQELEALAKSLNLCARSIQDAGHTEVDPGTTTVLGIGPAPVALINQVTGKLRLY
ncbi:hypothetical protein HGRIS_007631 [Hohenbuehelia grisea]|uniref:peptidyl-tRNA hydrolase n=1 Tax=Hohenbuehelia grisea TaxID=104357 RepID=A0ABR3J5F1_9AGAR